MVALAPLCRHRIACLALLLCVHAAAAHSCAAARQHAATTADRARSLSTVLDVSLEGLPAAQAALDDRRAYVPLRDGRLVSVDLDTGAIAWTLDLPTTRAPVIGAGRLFVAAEDHIVALTTGGRALWRLPVPGGIAAPLLTHGDSLIVSTVSNHELWRVRAADGTVVWRQALVAPLSAAPAADDRWLYLPMADNRVAGLAFDTGTPQWSEPVGGTPGALLVSGGRLYFGATDRFFYSLDAEDGDRHWRFRAGAAAVGVAAADDRHVYYTALDNVLRAHHRRNGSLRWKQGLPLRPSGGPVLIGDVVLVTGVAAEVRAYGARHGEPAGSFEAPRDLAAPPQVLRGDAPFLTRLVLLTRSGELQVLRQDVEPPIVPVPYPLGVPVEIGSTPF